MNRKCRLHCTFNCATSPLIEHPVTQYRIQIFYSQILVMFSMSLKFVVIEQRRKLHNWIPPTKTAEKTNQTHKRPSHKRIRPCKIQNPNIQKPSTRAIQPFNELGFPSKQKTKKPICGMCV